MTIQLSKFGSTLVSRPSGREAWLAFDYQLKQIPSAEPIEVDFDGVNTFTPSWADEFLTPLLRFAGQRLKLKKTGNLSVKATIDILEETGGLKFGWEV